MIFSDKLIVFKGGCGRGNKIGGKNEKGG